MEIRIQQIYVPMIYTCIYVLTIQGFLKIQIFLKPQIWMNSQYLFVYLFDYITMEGCRHIFREMKIVCRFPTSNHWRFPIKCMICYKLFLFNINLQPEILNRRHHYVIFSSLNFCVIVKFYIFVSDVNMLGHSVQSVCFFGHSLGIDKCSIYTDHF